MSLFARQTGIAPSRGTGGFSHGQYLFSTTASAFPIARKFATLVCCCLSSASPCKFVMVTKFVTVTKFCAC